MKAIFSFFFFLYLFFVDEIIDLRHFLLEIPPACVILAVAYLALSEGGCIIFKSDAAINRLNHA